jgi:large subunit ribosomal protein L21
MFAIVKTGGKQYKAEVEDVVIVDKLDGEEGAVKATIVLQGKAKKINAFNYKAKKNIRKRWGHRQPQTHIKIVSVTGGK